MADKNISKVSYLVGGLGLGSIIGMLLAPKSGEETREYLANKAKQGREYIQKQTPELKGRVEELVERGRDVLAVRGSLIATAVKVGREAYRREWDLAKKGK